MNLSALSLLSVALLLPLSSPASEARVLLEAPDGTTRERRLAEFECSSLRDLGVAWIRFSEAELLDVRDDESSALIEFQSGDRLRGKIVDGDAAGLVVELRGRIRLPLSIEKIRSLTFPSSLPPEGAALLVPAEEGDRLYRRTGDHLDRIDGAVESFSASGVSFESVLGTRKFEWSEVGALFIESFEEEGQEQTVEGESVVCDLVDGSRLRGQLKSVDRRGCRLLIAGAEELLVPVGVLSEISLDDGSVAYLSDLEPSAFDGGSLFGDDLGMRWPHRMDRSVTGTTLRSGGRGYTRGIGVHAPSSLEFTLDGGWRELRGFAAIDDQVLRLHSRGSVIFRVHVDDRLAWESEIVSGGTAPVTLPTISLAGAKKLVLVCDMSTEFAVADRANWLRMVLVRTEP